MQAFAVNIAEQEKAEAIMDKHMEDLGGLQNISKLSEEQKGPVTEFLRANRDEYAELAKQYVKSKDPAIKDKMDAIKSRFQNLDNQLNQFATNKVEYMHDYEEGNLMKGGTFAKDNAFYTSVYGDPNAQFTIDKDSGGMSFTAGGETRKLEDFSGHTLRQYDAEKNIDTLVSTAATLKRGGKGMDKNSFVSNFINGHKGISKNGLSALLQTDLTGDESNLSFMDQWASGTMSDEFYTGMEKDLNTGAYKVTEEDVNNLLKDKQRGLDLMGKFVGNVTQDIYDNTDVDPDILQTRQYKQAQIDAMRKKSKEEGDKTYKTSGNYFMSTGGDSGPRHVPVESVNPTIDAINSGKDYEKLQVPFNNDYKASRRVKGQYQLMPTSGTTPDDWVNVPDANTMALNLNIQNLLTSSGGTNKPKLTGWNK